ncbi:MAG: DUF374 domain-containing protein [Alphaproteobacteria bacterium]|nr:MAG: DUF374 domain-containing protein [Alphaproteobacteria bacterium]TAF13814.1 MAG: DUF374 domain-containing protein [Alphaproteobacteria bacterium]TAF41235.1 MAG: DUF374 domain-containing protein [Alphaproteobacteria bacterium]TAF75114.1 MAG: DUF374 domain-containing protein [Alphaproteobacteria bacterium]
MIRWKAHWKRFFKSERVHQFIGLVCAYYTRFVLLTGRMETIIDDHAKPYFDGTNQAIFVAWHSRMMLMQSHTPKGRPLHALVSSHADGRLIGRVLQHYGIDIIYGSTSRGGTQALRQLIAAYRNGDNLAITPDGPRGPAEIASEGVAHLAMLTNAPIICVSYASQRHHRLNSWDRFMVALPFSKIYFYAATPILPEDIITSHANKHTQRQLLRQAIESALHSITSQADQRIEPS